MILSIVQSRFTTILLGIVLITYAVYDIYEELFDPTHEHILILIGMILVISSFGHLSEGIHRIAQSTSPDKELNLLESIGSFFNRRFVRITLGITVIIAAIYGLYEDYEKLHSKSVTMGVGLFMLLLPIIKAYIGSNNIVKGMRNSSKESEIWD